MQGSGWGALAWEPVGQRLVVEQVYDHQGNIGNGTVPLLVLDMWEHAYYLQYQNVKATGSRRTGRSSTGRTWRSVSEGAHAGPRAVGWHAADRCTGPGASAGF